MSFVYLPTCCACSVAETKEQEAKAGHRPCSPCSPGFTPAAKRLPSARRPGTARRRGTGRQEGGCGRSSGAQGSVPAVRHAAMARPRPKQNRPRDGKARSTCPLQHRLPQPCPLRAQGELPPGSRGADLRASARGRRPRRRRRHLLTPSGMGRGRAAPGAAAATGGAGRRRGGRWEV